MELTRLGLDVRHLSHGLMGGVHSYVLHLARELPRVAPDIQFFYYADTKAPFELASLPPNVTMRFMRWRSPLSSVWNDRQLGAWMDRDRISVAHHPANYGRRMNRPAVITAHDAMNLFPVREQLRSHYGHPRLVATVLYLTHRMWSDLPNASHLITPSDHARRDVAVRAGYPLDRIVRIHYAADPLFQPLDDPDRLAGARQRYGLEHVVILGDAIKNSIAILDAYRALPPSVQAGCDVVLFSREPQPRPALARHLASMPRVRFIARPSTDELVTLMNLASVFVFPSWYEGFGLPVLEAMQSGTPVVGSSRGSIPEVVGDAGLIFEVSDVAGLSDRIAAVLESQTLRQELRRKGLARAATFSWQDTARRTVDVYRQSAATC